MKFLMIPVLMFSIGCRTTIWNHGIPNFSQVASGIYRGGQPTREGWEYLASIGILYDVKLNTDSEGSDREIVSYGAFVRKFPITPCQQIIGKPRSNDLWEAVQAIKPNTFVHCSHGWDRTGLVIGMYRVSVMGWDKKRAFSEMIDHGFHPILRGLYWSWEEDVVFPVDRHSRQD